MRHCVVLLFFVLISVNVTLADNRGIGLRPSYPSGELVAGDQWLLTIGIDEYVNWPRLNTAVNDARKIREILLQRYHFDKEHTVDLYNQDATRKNIIATLRQLAKKIKPSDSLFIFYAGHGQIDSITKTGSWIPVESELDESSAWITNHTIKDYLNSNAIKAKHVLLVSDSCFAGSFFRGYRKELPAINDIAIRKAYKRTSRQVITSGGMEPVSDSGFGGNSVFTHFLASALENNTEPYLIPAAIFPEVVAGVAQNAEQFPQIGALQGVGGQEGGEFVFFLKEGKSIPSRSNSVRKLPSLTLIKQLKYEVSTSSFGLKPDKATESWRIEIDLSGEDNPEITKPTWEGNNTLGFVIKNSSLSDEANRAYHTPDRALFKGVYVFPVSYESTQNVKVVISFTQKAKFDLSVRDGVLVISGHQKVALLKSS